MPPAISKSRTRFSKLRARLESRRKAEMPPVPAVNWLLGITLWLAVLGLSRGPRLPPTSALVIGQLARVPVVASVDFEVTDLEQTELRRQQAAADVPPVYAVDYAALRAACSTLERLVDLAAQAAGTSPSAATRPQAERMLSATLETLGVKLAAPDLIRALPEQREEEFLAALKDGLAQVWDGGIASAEEKRTLFHGLAPGGRVMVRVGPDQPARTIEVDDLLTPEDAVRAAAERALGAMPGRHRVTVPLLTELLRPLVAPNLCYQASETETVRARVQAAVAPVVVRIRSGTLLVEAGQRITPEILEKLTAHYRRLQQLETEGERTLRTLGEGGLLLLALVACVAWLSLAQPASLRSPKTVFLMALLSLLSLSAASGMLRVAVRTPRMPTWLFPYAQPLSLGPLLCAVLQPGPGVVAVGLWISLAAGVLHDLSLPAVLTGLLATLVVAHAARGVRRRAQLFHVGAKVGLAVSTCAAVLGVLQRVPPGTVAAQAAAAMGNGLVCGALTLLLIPLFETALGLTTDIRLLELSDLAHPLLQRLALEAPGTYHHSLMVANLASAAAREVGANDLLVRVCAYFHDIGKLVKPEFFSENVQWGTNPHDELPPSMSTLVIISHVKEGATMATQAKLPRVIVDGILQHHGTGLVSYFYHRARQQQEAQPSSAVTRSGVAVHEQEFRYPGPRPATPEMAILSLADAVEAASRSLEKPTPGRIESLVSEVVDSRLEDGQLDHSELTLAQLAAIRRSFVFTLANVFHTRIAYPQDENRARSAAAETSGAAPGDAPASEMAGGSPGTP